MEGVSIVNTAVLEALIGKVTNMETTMLNTLAELKDAKKPYLTAHDLMEITGFGKTWVNDNKQDIGFTTVGGCLRFKRKDVEEYMQQHYFKAKKRR